MESLTRRPTLLALAGGLVSAFAFQPFGLWPLMLLAFALLCWLLNRTKSLKGALALGWLFGLGQFVIGLNWIATAFTFQAKMPPWLGWIAVVLLSLYLAVYPMLATGLAWRFGKPRPIALVLALAGGWAITEWLRATMFTGFAWNPVGVALADTPLLGASRWIGTYGLSTLIVLIGGSLWLLARKDWRLAGGVAFASLALALLPAPAATPMPQRPIRIVQPNIGQQDKWTEGFEAVAAAKLNQLSMQSARPGSLLFWPEAAVTSPLSDERAAATPLIEIERSRAARVMPAYDLLITGGLGFLSNDRMTVTGATNSVFVLDDGGRIVGSYDKAHLVPYGEYLPMRPILSAIGLSRLAPGDLDFRPGPGPRSVQLPASWGKVGFQLCYEIIFSGEVVDRRDRPDFLFNPSNDAWFGSWGPPQHLAQARLRAAEEGLPVVRSTPTGISALIDPYGGVVASLPWQTPGVINTLLPDPLGPTLFARLGYIIPLALGFILLFAGIVLGRGRRYSTGI